jgi:hypothetical protein
LPDLSIGLDDFGEIRVALRGGFAPGSHGLSPPC